MHMWQSSIQQAAHSCIQPISEAQPPTAGLYVQKLLPVVSLTVTLSLSLSLQGIVLDTSGSVYVTGWVESSDFPTVAAFDSTLGGTHDAFVTKFSASGAALVYSTYLGGEGREHGYVCGLFLSGDLLFRRSII